MGGILLCEEVSGRVKQRLPLQTMDKMTNERKSPVRSISIWKDAKPLRRSLHMCAESLDLSRSLRTTGGATRYELRLAE